jgi:hypothetical protein
MRLWLTSIRQRPLLLVGLGVAAVLSIALVVGLVSITPPGDAGDAAPSSRPSAAPSPHDTPSPSPTPTPTPTAPAEPVSADPGTGSGAAPPAAPNPSEDAPGREPGVIGMNPGPTEGCGPAPSGQTQYLAFWYDSNPGNTVDIYYAYTDGDYQATNGFILLASGLPTSGSVSIPRTCPTDANGVFPLITVKVVARTPNGSATAYYSGI